MIILKEVTKNRIKIIENKLIFEGLKDAYSSYYSKNFTQEEFYKIASLDPTSNIENDVKGKYTNWLLDKIKTNKSLIDEITKDDLKYFDKNKTRLQNKDINQFKTFQEFNDMISVLKNTPLTSKQLQKSNQKAAHKVSKTMEGAELFYDSDEWTVWIPKTFEASCSLGRNTSWCTASTTGGPGQFNHYTAKGPLYILINNKTKEKFQFHFEYSSFMDREDEKIDIVKFFKKYTELKYAFKKYTSDSINFEGLTVIDSRTIPQFQTQFIQYIKIPGSVTRIGSYAFEGCSSLKSIEIPDSVTEIGDYAFNYCTSLKSIEIPGSVIEIGDYTFNYCSSLKSIEIPDSVTRIGDTAFGGCTSLQSIEIPGSVTRIGDDAFGGCTSLQSIEIPDSVTEIGDYAFEGCSSLQSIKIPGSVTRIGDDAFEGCISLKSIEIPNSVTRISDCAFKGCSSLKSIEIPDSVTEIGEDAFENCSSLTSIEIPDSVTEISWGAFNYCTSLQSIEIPGSVTEIGRGAFNYCSSLKSIEIPGSVTKIGWGAFKGCSSLQSITLPKRFSNDLEIIDINKEQTKVTFI